MGFRWDFAIDPRVSCITHGSRHGGHPIGLPSGDLRQMKARSVFTFGLAVWCLEGLLIPGCSGDDPAAPAGQSGTSASTSGGNSGSSGTSGTAGSTGGTDNAGNAGSPIGSGGSSGGSGG